MIGLHILFERASTFIACRQTTVLYSNRRKPTDMNVTYSYFSVFIYKSHSNARYSQLATARSVLFRLSQVRRRNSTRNSHSSRLFALAYWIFF